MKSILLFIMMFLTIMSPCDIMAQTTTNFVFDTVNWVLPDKYHILEFEGNQALRIENTVSDSYAYLKGYDFSDGIIEFDLYCPTTSAGFIGFLFRLNRYKEEDRFELFYFRPFMSNSLGAVQYIPVNNGVAYFQYYTDNVYQSIGSFPYNNWNHVKAEIAGPCAIVYVNDNKVMTVNNLGRGLSKGSVGLWMDSTTPICYYANFKVTK